MSYMNKDGYLVCCANCKYDAINTSVEPCKSCDDDYSNYEPAGNDDAVNHPSHYKQDGSIECIDEMIAVFGKDAVKNFCLLNVWKYRKRALYKNGDEDMQKSDWYMKKYLELK